jgi:hypothetical protein
MILLVVFIAVLVLVVLVGVAGADAIYLESGTHPLGERLRAWSGRYTLYATGIAAIAGALLGHFFWQ